MDARNRQEAAAARGSGCPRADGKRCGVRTRLGQGGCGASHRLDLWIET